MSDNKTFEWEGSSGSTHFKVSGSTDNDYVKELVAHGQAAIADAEKADDEDEDDGPQDFLSMLQSIIPQGIRIAQGGPGGLVDDDRCPHEKLMDIIVTLGRNDWSLSIDTDEDGWVVTAQHPEHGLTQNKDEHLFDALVQTGDELRQYVKQADA